MKFVLILFMSNAGNGVAIDHIPFQSLALCEAALNAVQSDSRPIIKGYCVPAEEPTP